MSYDVWDLSWENSKAESELVDEDWNHLKTHSLTILEVDYQLKQGHLASPGNLSSSSQLGAWLPR